MTVTTAQSVSLLENVLFESPTVAAANAGQWVTLSQTNSADSTLGGLAQAMSSSAEAGIAEQVVRYYEGLLGRTPSGLEVAFYVKFAEAGLSPSQIAQGPSAISTATWGQIATYFTASAEFQTDTKGSSNIIPFFYLNILGRVPSTDETAFYQKALDSGTPVSTLAEYFVNSPEYQGKINAATPYILARYGLDILAGTATPSTPIEKVHFYDLMIHSVGASTDTWVYADSAPASVTTLDAGTSSIQVSDTTVTAHLLQIRLTGMPAGNSLTVTDPYADSVVLNLSSLSGTKTPIYTLPAGADNFVYDGVTFHLSVAPAPVELVGVTSSAVQILS